MHADKVLLSLHSKKAGWAHVQVYLALAAVLASGPGETSRILSEAELDASNLAGRDANQGLAAKAAATVAKSSKLTNVLTGKSAGNLSARGAKGAGASAADDSISAAQSQFVGR